MQFSVHQKTQLFATLILMSVLSFAMSSVYFASRTKAAAHRLLQTGLSADRAVNDIELLLQRYQAFTTRPAIWPDVQSPGGPEGEQKRLEQGLRGEVASAAVPAGYGEEAGFAELLIHLNRELTALFGAGRLVQYSQAGHYETLVKLTNEQQYSRLFDHLQSEISEWRSKHAEAVDQQVIEFFNYSDRLVKWVYAGTLATLALGVIGFALMEQLLKRMGLLQRTMLRLAAQDLNVVIPGLKAADEIGEVARAIEVFKRNAIQIARQQEELRENGLRFEAALNNMSQGLVLFDPTGALAVFNRRYCEIFNVSPDDLFMGMSLQAVMATLVIAGNFPGQSVDELVAEIKVVSGQNKGWTTLKTIDAKRTISVSYCPMQDGGWVATCDDVTDRQAAEAHIRYLAQHDSLTGLPNRIMLHDGLDRALVAAGRGIGSAVLCLDLDRFKAVNDTLGHHVGDRLLCAVAERLLACVRDGDIVTRLGGDEFAIIQTAVTRPEDAKLLAERILDSMQDVFVIGDNQIVIGTSIGLALIPQDGNSGTAFLKNADTALYRAKADGRGGFCFFEAEMDARLQHRRQIELDLRKGLVQREFEVAYQPLVNIEAREVCGFEALLRWRHPERGMISPADFIPIAEEIGLIVPLGDWVLNQACIDAASWPDAVKVAVNLSPVQFKGKNLVAAVARALKNSGLPAHRLELEITETVLLQESANTLATLHELRAIGVRISMDDFGTGYSSLSYLRSFPFDKIKIDQSFIRDLSRRPDSIHIVRAVRGLCAGLGMLTTAEGVETEDQLEKLRAEGCTEVQGFLFSPARPACEVLSIMAVVGENMRGRTRRPTTELVSADWNIMS